MDERVDSDGEDAPGPPVPVTILTGFLGAGKTSLLRHVLTEPHGLKIAVVQNELSAAVGLEEATVRGPNGEEFAEWMELANGCVCCAVRDDLVQCMEKLVQMKSFDYVLIETTGMADPGPVAASFWLDDALESPLKLDGIVTVVDGHNLSKQLGTLEACRQVSPCPNCVLLPLLRQPRCALRAQIASADCLLINKIDGLDPGHLAAQHAHRRRLCSAKLAHWPPGAGLQALGGATHCAAQGSWEAAVQPCGCKAEDVADPVASTHASRWSSRRTCATSTRRRTCCALSTRASPCRQQPDPRLHSHLRSPPHPISCLHPRNPPHPHLCPPVRSPARSSHPRPPPLPRLACQSILHLRAFDAQPRPLDIPYGGDGGAWGGGRAPPAHHAPTWARAPPRPAGGGGGGGAASEGEADAARLDLICGECGEDGEDGEDGGDGEGGEGAAAAAAPPRWLHKDGTFGQLTLTELGCMQLEPLEKARGR